MKTQQAGQDNSLLEVNVIPPEEMDFLPRSTASPELPKHCFQGMGSLVRMMGLVILGLVVGFILAMVIYKPADKQDPGPLNHAEKVYVNGSLKKESGEQGRYDIFHPSKNAHYFIYVQVKHNIPKGLVYLKHCWQTVENCEEVSANIHCKDSYYSYFDTELKLFKGSSVYLHFNENNDKPVEKESFFRIFEI